MTTRIETPLGTMFVNITEDEKGQPFEVFINLGKAGGAAMADVEAMGRLISLSLRSGIPIKEVHRQLRGIASDRAIGLGPNKVLSVPDAIGIALENWMREKQGIQQELLKAESSAPAELERRSRRRRPERRSARIADSVRVRQGERRGDVHWHVPGLRVIHGNGGRVRQVPRVRVLRMRVS